MNVIHDDCINALQKQENNSIDVCFIDPPYNTGNNTNKAIAYDRNEDYIKKNWKPFYSDWDTIPDYEKWCISWLDVLRDKLKEDATVFICGSFHNIPDVAYALRKLDYYTIQWVQWCIPNAFPNLSMTKMINANQTIIWARKDKKHYYDKVAAKAYNNDKNLRDYWLLHQDHKKGRIVKRPSRYLKDFWLMNNDTTAGKLWKHPSKKPVALVERALDIALRKEDGVHVLDFFAGSGTTGIAVKELAAQYNINIECTLVDNKQEYIDMMKRRLDDSK